MRPSAALIRAQFIDFFVKKAGHTFVPSSPVVPHDDPTLLFTNAGMNQFKPLFLNQVPPGSPLAGLKRAVNSQKCIRAGGKHNDLEDVGRDTYHHTFFEMLGNWSFGDYFKKEAIDWAWDLVVNTWKLDPRRLHATYFQGDAPENLAPDNDARDLWLRYLPPDHVHPGNKKDNFWEMGDTGPCGPCSELHYDGTPDISGGKLVNAGDPSVIEFWNLVFIQFNRGPDGKLTPLPAKHVDTGMGFERIVRILQHSTSNYDTDVWSPIFLAIEQHTGAHTYTGKLSEPIDIAYRVVADHIRCLVVAITDGARPSNEGRGYVLRRVLRRAVRMAHQYLGAKGPFLCELVPAVVNSLGEAFPELKKDPKRIASIIREEEEAFLKTLDRGIELFDQAIQRAKSASSPSATLGISASDAFKLHDTYGFPIDLTRVMAEERGLSVDVAGFEKLMDEARAKSKASAAADASADINFTLPPDALASLARLNIKPTDDSHKFAAKPITAEILAIWNGENFDEHAHLGRRVAVILNRTNLYAEQGGQVGDQGEIRRNFADMGTLPVRGMAARAGRADCVFRIEDTQAFGGYVLHIGRVTENQLNVHDRVTISLDHHARDLIQSNHTATHLLNHALREILGDDIHQKGSLVAADRLRFDFSYPKALEESHLLQVQAHVNAALDADLHVFDAQAPLAIAKTFAGVRAVFGERYPDPVRVVSIGVSVQDLLANPANPAWRRHSIEFCGGTHLRSTADARRFIILSEGALAAGVRRIIALTGPAAQAADLAANDLLARVENAARLADDLLPAEFDETSRLAEQLTLGLLDRRTITTRLDALRDRLKSLLKKQQSASRDSLVTTARTLADRFASLADSVIIESLPGADKDSILSALDVLKSRLPDKAVMLLSPDESQGKVFIVAAVPKTFIQRGLKAGEWVKLAAEICGGGGGGRPDLAQAGGKDPAKLPDAISSARGFANRKLAQPAM